MRILEIFWTCFLKPWRRQVSRLDVEVKVIADQEMTEHNPRSSGIEYGKPTFGKGTEKLSIRVGQDIAIAAGRLDDEVRGYFYAQTLVNPARRCSFKRIDQKKAAGFKRLGYRAALVIVLSLYVGVLSSQNFGRQNHPMNRLSSNEAVLNYWEEQNPTVNETYRKISEILSGHEKSGYGDLEIREKIWFMCSIALWQTITRARIG